MSRRTNRSMLHTGYMRWEALAVKDSVGKAWIKTLSKDPETGGRTALIKFDAGFRQERATSNLPMDMYVLEGEMESGDLHFEPDTFHYRPGNSEYGPIETRLGITRLVFTVDSDRESPDGPVFIQDVKQMTHARHHLDPEGLGRGAKVLRQDRRSGVSLRVHETWQVGFRGVPGIQHMHDHGEEFFVIAGEFHDYLEEVDGHVHLAPGFYGCRRPNESSHGDTVTVFAPSKLVVRLDLFNSDASMDAGEYGRDLESHSPSRPVLPISFVE